MSGFDLEHVRSLLSSSKIRDRNEGLVRLEDTNITSKIFVENLTPKVLYCLLESLHFCLSHDIIIQSRGSSSSLASCEERLHRASSIFKTLVQTSVPHYTKKLKNIHIESILRFARDGSCKLNYEDGRPTYNIIEATGYNLIYSILELLNIQSLKDHLKDSEYTRIIEFTLNVLDTISLSESSVNERYFVLLFQIFNSFLSPQYTSTLSIMKNEVYAKRILSVILNCRKNQHNFVRVSSQSLIHIFRILNGLLVNFSLSNIKLSHQIYLMGTKFINNLDSISQPLKHEIVAFIIFSHPFINAAKLPKLADDHWNFDTDGTVIQESEEEQDYRELSISSADSTSTLNDTDLFIQNQLKGGTSSTHMSNINIFKNLKLLINKLLVWSTDISGFESHTSLINEIQINQFPDSNSNGLFDLRFFSFQGNNSGSLHWLMTLGISKLLTEFYDMKALVSPKLEREVDPELNSLDVEMVDVSSSILPSDSNLDSSSVFFDNHHTDRRQHSQHANKRRRTENKYASFDITDMNLTKYDSTIEFLLSFVSNSILHSNNKLCATALELLLFHIADSACNSHLNVQSSIIISLAKNSNTVIDSLLKFFEAQDETIDVWVLLILFTIFSILTQISEPSLTFQVESTNVLRVLRYSLEMIRSDVLCKPACSLLSIILRCGCNKSPKVIELKKIDKTIITQFETLIDLAEIKGPSVICKESILFWFDVAALSKVFSFQSIKLYNSRLTSNLQTAEGDTTGPRVKLFSYKVSNWLLSNWSQLKIIEEYKDIYFVSLFIKWVSIEKEIEVKPFKSIERSSYCTYPLLKVWEQQSYTLNYILLRLDYFETDNVGNSIHFEDVLYSTPELLGIDNKMRRKVMTELITELKSLAYTSPKHILFCWLLNLEMVTDSFGDDDDQLSIFFNNSYSSLLKVEIEILNSANDSYAIRSSKIAILKMMNLSSDFSLFKTQEYSSFNVETLFDLANFEENKDSSLDFEFSNVNEEVMDKAADPYFLFHSGLNQHTQTDLQVIMRFLFRHYVVRELLVSSTGSLMAGSIDQIFLFVKQIESPVRKCTCLYELSRLFEEYDISELLPSDLEDLTGILISLLDTYELHVFELSLVAICKLILQFSKTWSKNTESAVYIDCIDILNYLSDLYNSKLLHSMCSVEVLVSIYLCSFNSSLEMLEERQTHTCTILKDMGAAFMISTLEQLTAYIRFSSDRRFYGKVIDLMSSWRSIEQSAIYNICCSWLVSDSYQLSLDSISFLLKFSSQPHFKKYLAASLKKVALSNGYTSPLELYDAHRVSILLMYVKGHGSNVIKFPFDVFGYKEFYSFVRSNYTTLTAILLIFSNDFVPDLNTILSCLRLNRQSLLFSSFPEIMTLAYSTGKRKLVIDRLENAFEVETPKLSSYEEECKSLIILEMFKLCDVGNESKIYSYLSEKLSSKYLRIGSDVPDLSLDVDAEQKYLLVSLERHINLLKNNSYLAPDMFFFLSSRLMLLLETSSSSHDVAKLMILRKIQLLLNLACYNFGELEILSLYVNTMVKYFANPFLSVPASYILLEVLTKYKSAGKNMTHDHGKIEKLWIIIINKLIIMNKNHSENKWTKKLVLVLEEMVKDTPDGTILKNFIWHGLKYLTTNQVQLPLSLLGSLIDWLADRNMNDTLDVVKSISLLFDLMDMTQLVQYNSLRISSKSIDYLFSIKDSSSNFSIPFNAFVARLLGHYYSRTGVINEYCKSKYIYDADKYKDNFNQKVSSLDILFQKIIEDKRNTFDIVSLTGMHAIVGSLIYTKNTLGNGGLDCIVSSDLFTRFESYSLAINPIVGHLLCDVSQGEVSLIDGTPLSQFIDHYELITGAQTPEKWLLRLFFSLIIDIKNKSPVLIMFADYVSQNVSFVYEALPHLVLYYLNCTNSKANYSIVKLISKVFSSNMNTTPKSVIRLFLEIVLLIRVGSLNLSKKYEAVYRKLDKMRISDAAFHAGCPKTSLIFFEEVHLEMRASNDSLMDKRSEFLYSLYSHINVDDLMFGLPVHPVLAHGLGAIKHQNFKESMTFSTSSFNAALSMGLSTKKHASEMLGGFVSDGQLGISKVLGEFLGNSLEGADQEYETSWKLNQWDLPYSSDLNSENKIIYQTLNSIRHLGESKSLSASTPTNDYKTAFYSLFCESFSSLLVNFDGFGIFKEFKSKEKSLSWFRTLATICNIEDLIHTSINVSNFTHDISENVQWYLLENFEHYENILLGRKASLELGHYFSPDQSSMNGFIVRELDRYSELSGLSKQYQKQVNCAVYLDGFIEKNISRDSSLYKAAKRISTFNLASSIWNQKDQSTLPVEMLASIIKNDERDLSSSEKRFPWGNTLPTHYIKAVIAKWSALSSQITTENIMEEYIKPIVKAMRASDEVSIKDSEIFYMFAEFCDNQIRLGVFDRDADTLQRSLKQKQKEMTQLENYVKDQSNSKEERKNASRVYKRLDISFKRDKEELKICMNNKISCIEQAASHYISSLCLDEHHDETAIDRFCALWMEYSDTSIDAKALLSVPTYKFIPWVSQLMSRLSKEKRNFQKVLGNLLLQLCVSHPYHSLFILYSLRLSNKSDDALAVNRSLAAESLWAQVATVLGKKSSVGNLLVSKITTLCSASVNLANEKLSRTKDKVSLKNLKSGLPWLKEIPESQMVIPTVSIPIDKTSEYHVEHLPTISSISSHITLAASGISVPKIMKMTLSDGSIHKVLFKGGGDDLRQDAIMEQVFEKVNILLNKNQETRSRNLSVRTYKVVPLGTGSGLIQFVTGTVSLDKILNELHSNDELSISQARAMMKQVQTKSTFERINVYQKITSMIHPMMHRFFLINFFSPDLWLTNRVNYSRGMAVNSIVGHILGLGDRHNNNILLDFHTCEPVHIDLGIAFDQGKALPIPELVPFRLTRDVVDGLGITGVNGIFSKACEKTFQVLRENSQYISGILDVLKYDPLYSWTISPIRKKRLQEQLLNDDDDDATFEKSQKRNPTALNIGRPSISEEGGSEANIAIMGVLNKLEAKNLSSEVVVRDLIRQATDEKNLALIFLGWCPFL